MGAENTLLSDDIQDFVRSDEAARMLSSGIVKSPFPDVSLSALSVQIKGFLKSILNILLNREPADPSSENMG